MATPNFRNSNSAPDNAPGKARRPSPLHRLSQSEAEDAATAAHNTEQSAQGNQNARDLALFAGETDLSDAGLSESDFNGSNLNGSNLNGSGLNRADLDTADDESIREFYGRLVTLLTQDGESDSGRKKGGNPILVALRRRWLPALVLMALAFLGLYSLLKPRQFTYLASTTLLLPPQGAANDKDKDPFAPPEDSYDTKAQLAIIGSDPIVNRALSRVPAELRQRGWGDPNIKRVGVNVDSLESDSLVDISVASRDSKASVRLVNEMVAAYQQYTKNRYSQTKSANLDLTRQRVQKAARDLARARRELRDYKERTGVFDATAQQTSSAARINDLETALSTARREQATVTTDDATVQELQRSAVEAGNKLRAILRDFERDAPRARVAQEEYDQANAQAQARVTQLSQDSARRISQLESALAQARSDAANLPAAEQDLNRLNERVTLLETVYRNANGRADQLGLASGTIAATAKTLQPTDVYSDLSMKRARALGVSMLGALLLGLVCALGLDRLDHSVRATRDPAALFEAPVLGALPAIKARGARFIGSAQAQGNVRARTATLEACYNAQSHILSAAAAAGARSILFTSSLPEEGKSQCAANLAAAMAYGGHQVLLIDSDFWNPTQHEILEKELAPGYAQVLRDEAQLSQTIRSTDVPNLHLLSAGQSVTLPVKGQNGNSGELIGLLAGESHYHTMSVLKRFFDIIILDAPPVMSVSDAQLLAGLSDATVLVASARTNREQVQRARSMLRLAGADLLGVVINSVRQGEVQRWNVDFSPEEPFSHYSNSLSTY